MDNKNVKTVLCGREFTDEEIDDIKYIVKRFPLLSRTELANTICENINWIDAKGNNKFNSAAELLLKLESKGEIKLPERQGKGRIKSSGITFSKATDKPEKILIELKPLEPIKLELVLEKKYRDLWNEYIARYHYLGYQNPFGAHQRYYILSRQGEKLGCILFAASAWTLAERDKWIGWTSEDRIKNLNLIINNTRFLIFPWVQVKNLASKVLSLAIKQVSSDWFNRYGYEPVLLETFVDTEKYKGTCYRAANWVYIGNTTGRGRMDRYNQKELSQKQIYMYPLVKDYKKYLFTKIEGDL